MAASHVENSCTATTVLNSLVTELLWQFLLTVRNADLLRVGRIPRMFKLSTEFIKFFFSEVSD
jgi:hypothetical protein